MPEIIAKTENILNPEQTTWQFIKPYLIGGLIIMVILALLIWLVMWIIKKIKQNQDVYYRIKRQRKKLCAMHADKFRYRSFWWYKRNDPLKCVHFDNNNHYITKKVGNYMGHFYGSEGNLIVAFANSRKWFILYPTIELLIINKNIDVVYQVNTEEIDDKGVKKIVKKEIKQDLPTDIEQFTDEGVMLFAYGIDMDERSTFYFPVLKSKDGKIVELALPTFQSMKDVIMTSYMYDTVDSFAKLSKKGMELNPQIRSIQKIQDSSQSIDTKEQG